MDTHAVRMDIDVTTLRGRRAVQRWERTSVGDVFERVTWSHPDKVAITAAGRARTARTRSPASPTAQADAAANQLAHALAARGLAPGDRVLLFCENSVEAFLAKIGIAKAGMVAVPLNPNLAPDVVEHLIGLTEPKLAIVDAELWPRAQAPFAATGLAVGGVRAGRRRPAPSFGELLAGQPDHRARRRDPRRRRVGAAVHLRHHGDAQGRDDLALVDVRRGDELRALALPRGAPRVRPEDRHVPADDLPRRRPDLHVLRVPRRRLARARPRAPSRTPVAEAVAAERATALWAGSPQFVTALADHPRRAARARRHVADACSSTAGARSRPRCSPVAGEALRRRVRRARDLRPDRGHRLPPLLARQVARGARGDAPRPSTTSGCPARCWPPTSSTSWDRRSVACPARPSTARPPSPPGTTATRRPPREAFRGGWFHSGDSAQVDDDGLRIMVDRYKDIVKTGGENVSSQRVEAVLHEHPAVLRAAVIGLPHERWGEAVTAVVVPRDGTDTRRGRDRRATAASASPASRPRRPWSSRRSSPRRWAARSSSTSSARPTPVSTAHDRVEVGVSAVRTAITPTSTRS